MNGKQSLCLLTTVFLDWFERMNENRNENMGTLFRGAAAGYTMGIDDAIKVILRYGEKAIVFNGKPYVFHGDPLWEKIKGDLITELCRLKGGEEE